MGIILSKSLHNTPTCGNFRSIDVLVTKHKNAPFVVLASAGSLDLELEERKKILPSDERRNLSDLNFETEWVCEKTQRKVFMLHRRLYKMLIEIYIKESLMVFDAKPCNKFKTNCRYEKNLEKLKDATNYYASHFSVLLLEMWNVIQTNTSEPSAIFIQSLPSTQARNNNEITLGISWSSRKSQRGLLNKLRNFKNYLIRKVWHCYFF